MAREAMTGLATPRPVPPHPTPSHLPRQDQNHLHARVQNQCGKQHVQHAHVRGHVQHLKPGGGAGGLGGGDGGLGSGASHQRYCSGLLGARQFALEFESQLSAGSNLMQLSQLTGSGARGHVQQPKLMGPGLGAPASEARVRGPLEAAAGDASQPHDGALMVRARGVRSTSSNSAN